MCGVGRWLQRWREKNHNRCPLCSEANETVEHVLRCQHPGAINCWKLGLEELQKWLRSHKASPLISEAVMVGLNNLDNADRGAISVNHLISAQHSLGWKGFMFGALHKHWREEQERHLSSIGSKSSGLAWISKLIRQMWVLQHSTWKHRCN